MTIYDLVNGGFELAGASFNLLNVRALLRDKAVRGVSVLPMAVFTLWGLWNMFFYSYLGQTVSLFAGLLTFLANAAWVGLAVYFHLGPTKRD